MNCIYVAGFFCVDEHVDIYFISGVNFPHHFGTGIYDWGKEATKLKIQEIHFNTRKNMKCWLNCV